MASFGITSPLDLLFLLPRRYEDRRAPIPIASLKPGDRVLTGGSIVGVRVYGRPWRRIMEVELEDDGATIKGMWFTNQRPSPDRFTKGEKVYLAGLVSLNKKGVLQIAHPVVIDEDDPTCRKGRIIPIYPRLPKIKAHTVEKAVQSVARRIHELVEDPVPLSLLTHRNLPPLGKALEQMHLPPEEIPSEEVQDLIHSCSPAHKRLIYDEFFFLQLALALKRANHFRHQAPVAKNLDGIAEEMGKLLRITPTNAQSRVIGEIVKDMTRPFPMQRLLQGDVGSGKTFVALSAIVATVRSGFQAALMAPTEVLAEQHMRTLSPILERLNIRTVLHVGQTTTATRKSTLSALEQGTVQVAIGTHALIQEAVSFQCLGLAVVDEQHRFGVSQRLSLVGKGPDNAVPHLLVMTATPIPRTLALTVHGDLDISVLDELPPGRAKIVTRIWPREMREQVLTEISPALERGEQVYVVCPTIEESSNLDLNSLETVYEELSNRFGANRTGLLHGRLSQEEKEAVMADFSKGKKPLLVTTTVVEVGVDVQKATVMVIENAERFGLAQLHQLRGRVGRSHLTSCCHLIADPKNPDAFARLSVLSRTCDGFEIAEADLGIRGPGEIFGRIQAGLPGFRFGNLSRDADLLDAAREDVQHLIANDNSFDSPTLMRLQNELTRRIAKGNGPVAEEAG
jgi:ATP-dependent DNA helicase RecG